MVIVLYRCSIFLSDQSVRDKKKICEHFTSMTEIFLISPEGGEEGKMLMGETAEGRYMSFIYQTSGRLQDFSQPFM